MVKDLPAMQETQVQSLGWEDLLEKAWQSTSVFLPGESHRQRSLAGYNLSSCMESDTTEQLTLQPIYIGMGRDKCKLNIYIHKC